MPTLVKILLSGGWTFLRPILAELAMVLTKDFIDLIQQFVVEAEKHPGWTGEQKKEFVIQWLSNYHPAVTNRLTRAVIEMLIAAAVHRMNRGIDPAPFPVPEPSVIYGKQLDTRPEGVKNGDRIYFNRALGGWYVDPAGKSTAPSGYTLVEVIGVK